MGICNQANAQESAELITIHHGVAEALDAHDFDKFLSYFTDDAVYDFVPYPMVMNSKEEIRIFFEDLLVSFPDFSTTEGRVLASGNILVVDHSLVGTHLGVWEGVPLTGNTFLL